MRKYSLVAVLAIEILLISSSFVSGAPSHQNIDEALEDPEVLYSYFLEDIGRASTIIWLLAGEDFTGADVEQLLFSAHLEVPRQIALETETKGLSDLQLPLYYRSFQEIYDELDTISGLQSELSSLLEEFEMLDDMSGMESELLTADTLLANIDSDVGRLRENVEVLVPLGYETSGTMGGISALEATLDRYALIISELEKEASYEEDMLHIIVTRSDVQEYYGVRVSGFFYYEGIPIAGHGLTLHFNEKRSEIWTGLDGRFDYDYALPLDMGSDRLEVFVDTEYDGKRLVSNTVTLDIQIGTMLSLSRTYDYDTSSGVASIFLSGELKDIYGNDLSARDITISVNGSMAVVQTDPHGRYEYSFQESIDERGTYTAFSEYAPDGGEPYLSSRSQTLVFNIYADGGGQERDLWHRILENLGAILAFALILAFFAMVVPIYRRIAKRAASGKGAGPLGRGADDVGSGSDTLIREIGILERIGNAKESVILGYSRMLDFLHSIGIITLSPSTTHMDVHRTLMRIPDSESDASSITSTFELARYSRRGIDQSRKASFFIAMRRFLNKMGGGR